LNPKINIAIDGHSSCGKGTLAKYLADQFGYRFIDTGSMYRAVTYAISKENIDLKDKDAIKTLLQTQNLRIEPVENQHKLALHYKGEDISEAIRMPSVSNQVSQVSEIDIVRTYLVKKQQEMAQSKGIVMDGRDIGTHVLPEAELKIFMTADAKIRAQRRFEELEAKKVNITYDQVLENIIFRDKTDSSRDINPLIQAEDAKILDNSSLSVDEQNSIAKKWVDEILSH